MLKIKNVVLLFLIFLMSTSTVFAANWPNMTTGTTGNSGGTSGGGSGYVLSANGSRTRYTLTDQNGTVIKKYVDTSGLIGNTHEWFILKNR